MSGPPHLPTGFYHSGSNHQGLPPPPPPPPPPSSVNQRAPPPFSYSYNYNASSGVSAASVYGQPLIATTTNTETAEPNDTTNRDSATTKSRWHCDACELTLDSEQALKSHRKSHVKCSDCSLEGAPKVVKAHYESVHGRFSRAGFKTVTVAIPGSRVQRFRICVGNRPEDIQKWIVERKKRFPRKNPPPPKKDEPLPVPQDPEKVGGDAGLSSLLAGYGSSSGSEDEKREPPKKYGDGKPDTRPTDPNTKKDRNNIDGAPRLDASNERKPQSAQRPCRYFMRNGTCLNGEACRFSHDLANRHPNNSPNNRKRKRGGHTSSDTLLRKLLTNDMQREATLTMQMLKYIVDSNFFDGTSSKKKPDSEG